MVDLQRALLNEINGILRGFHHGFVYGTKIRLPHALVMTILFRNGDLRKKLASILQLTYEHAANLGSFVALYKLALAAMKVITGHALTPETTGQPVNALHAGLAGALGAAYVWRQPSAVNTQIALYLLGRVVLAFIRTLAHKGIWPFRAVTFKQHGFPMMTIATWTIVMYLHTAYKQTLQRSLASSMDYLYLQSNELGSLADFLPSNTAAVVLVFALSKRLFNIDLTEQVALSANKILQSSTLVKTGVASLVSMASLVGIALPRVNALLFQAEQNTSCQSSSNNAENGFVCERCKSKNYGQGKTDTETSVATETSTITHTPRERRRSSTGAKNQSTLVYSTTSTPNTYASNRAVVAAPDKSIEYSASSGKASYEDQMEYRTEDATHNDHDVSIYHTPAQFSSLEKRSRSMNESDMKLTRSPVRQAPNDHATTVTPGSMTHLHNTEDSARSSSQASVLSHSSYASTSDAGSGDIRRKAHELISVLDRRLPREDDDTSMHDKSDDHENDVTVYPCLPSSPSQSTMDFAPTRSSSVSMDNPYSE